MSENKQYKLVIAYDGTDFQGWQIQKNKKSVADCIQQRFYAVFKKEIHLIGASRTDAGVHAFGQVATFHTDLAITEDALQRALQASMPSSIVIRSVHEVPNSFHARFDVIHKIYHYRLFFEQPLPWQQRYGYFHEKSIDCVLLDKALSLFVGTHDFRSFCSGDEHRSTVRTLEAIETIKEDTTLSIVFKAKGFLRYMIRRIIGAALNVAEGKMAFERLQKALLEKNPNQAFMMAPPHGLRLHEVYYK